MPLFFQRRQYRVRDFLPVVNHLQPADGGYLIRKRSEVRATPWNFSCLWKIHTESGITASWIKKRRFRSTSRSNIHDSVLEVAVDEHVETFRDRVRLHQTRRVKIPDDFETNLRILS